MDGTGYPDNLSGTRIPLESRIICAAETYDAMTRRCGYGSPATPQEAVAELRRYRDQQFDSLIVDILTDLLRAEGHLSLPAGEAIPRDAASWAEPETRECR